MPLFGLFLFVDWRGEGQPPPPAFDLMPGPLRSPPQRAGPSQRREAGGRDSGGGPDGGGREGRCGVQGGERGRAPAGRRARGREDEFLGLERRHPVAQQEGQLAGDPEHRQLTASHGEVWPNLA